MNNQEILKERFSHWQYQDDTLRIKYLIHPDYSTSPVLVFLHDALGSIAQWQSFPQLVAEHLRRNAVIYERVGHGGSSAFSQTRDQEYLHREALEVLPQLLKDLKIERPILIGHSDGGSIALIYAAYHPTSLVISMAAHILVEEITLEGIRQAANQRSFLESKLKKYHGDKTPDLFQAWAKIWLSSTFTTWNIQKEIQGIACPVLVIQGEDDPYGSAKQVEGIVEALPLGQVIPFWIEAGKHMPHLEVPEQLAQKIQEFVNAYFN